jgi:non-ribosomal peptide synthetase component E (peptide arylation enzyme)
MTEMGGAFYTRPEDPPEIIEQTVGRASGPCVVAVVDEEGKRLSEGQEGELIIRSPFAIEAYFKNPEATAESVMSDGWFRTGDLGRMDPEGNIQILGRQKELINRGGVKFLPQNVEEVLLNHPGVHMVAVVGMPDDRLGERNACFVVPASGEDPPSLEELCRLLEREGTSKCMWPERLEIVESLPLTPTGKIQRALLRKRAIEQLNNGAEQSSNRTAEQVKGWNHSLRNYFALSFYCSFVLLIHCSLQLPVRETPLPSLLSGTGRPLVESSIRPSLVGPPSSEHTAGIDCV